MKVRIYKPSKNAMQSGRANSKKWVLEYEAATPRKPEPVMGWVSSEDTLNQVKMSFETQEAAVAFAKEKGWEAEVEASQARKIKPQNYIDNFKYRPAEDK